MILNISFIKPHMNDSRHPNVLSSSACFRVFAPNRKSISLVVYSIALMISSCSEQSTYTTFSFFVLNCVTIWASRYDFPIPTLPVMSKSRFVLAVIHWSISC